MNESISLWSVTLRKFIKNRLGLLCLIYIITCALISIFCYFLTPDNSNNANKMHLEIHSKPPGFNCLMLTVPSHKKTKTNFFETLFQGKAKTDPEIPIRSYAIENNHLKISKYPEGMSKLYPLEIFKNEPGKFIKNKTFWLGTDKYGRDLLSRLLIGTRISFSIGFVAVFISLIIGIPVGAIAGYFGGKIDTLIMLIINITWSIPTLLLVIAITLVLGKGFWQVFIAVGLTMWVEIARIIRGQVISCKEEQYIEAAKALGYSDFRIIFKHIIPNIFAPIIVISAANFASAILIESGLSFLGIGTQPPIPSWGSMIKNHYNYIILGKPFLAIVPGIAIMCLVMSFMLLGNVLRDVLDVKS